jgi:hypothetical protein
VNRYTVRYRGDIPGRSVALLVEDEHGAVHHFSGGQLQGGLKDQGAAERLVRLLERRMTLSSVPEGGPYTLEGLCYLVGVSSVDGAPIVAEAVLVPQS